MKKLIVCCAVLAAGGLAWAAAPGTDDDPVTIAIKAAIAEQRDCWNRGDLDGFLKSYWRSPGLTFSSGGETRRGFEATRKRFREAYPTNERMGRASFSDLEINPLSDSAAFVLGRWELTRTDEADQEPLGGNFTLVMRKIDGRWLIVHDHTSRRPAETAPSGEASGERDAEKAGR